MLRQNVWFQEAAVSWFLCLMSLTNNFKLRQVGDETYIKAWIFQASLECKTLGNSIGLMMSTFPSDMHSVSPRNDIGHDKKLQHDIQTLQCYMEHHTPVRTPLCHPTPTGHVVACGDCGKRFTWNKSLMLHRKSRHSGTQYQCSTCKRMFNRMDNFERHKRLMHKGHVIWGYRSTMNGTSTRWVQKTKQYGGATVVLHTKHGMKHRPINWLILQNTQWKLLALLWMLTFGWRRWTLPFPTTSL